MRRLFLFLAILFLMVGIAYGRGYEFKKTVNDYEAQVKLDRYPPTLGDNNIEIEIRDCAGKYVTDAKVLVNYYMPPMPRMAPMNYTTEAKLRGERYKTAMKFIMTGPWIISVKINHGGRVSTAKFNVDAQ
jgi:nitrogen fixation protein FixH